MISHPHRFIFIHIPKCAGRSISDALGEPFDHYTAAYYQAYHSDLWNDYTVFTIVRNPYQRLVSMYHYIKNEPFHANHTITRHGNMLPFKKWVMQNISLFAKEFDFNSPEGNRETDGCNGSPFWLSSQSRRLSNESGVINGNIQMLRYESGMNAVEGFLYQHTGVLFNIPHLNNSRSNDRKPYLSYYDDELLVAINAFEPFACDCRIFGYDVVEKADPKFLTA